MPKLDNQRLRVLHLILATAETNGQYNEHCLPMIHKREITICTFFKSKVTPPSEITLFEGDDTIGGFFRAFKAAIDAKTYDVIHCHVPHTGVLLLAAVLRYGLFKQVMPITVYTVQNSYQNYKLRNRLLMLPVFAAFKQLVFCGHACLASYPTLFKVLGGKRTNVAQNAVDITRVDRITEKITRKRGDAQVTIASVGRLIQIKNPFTLLSAFQKAAESTTQLVFIGEGNLRPALAQEVEQQGLQQQVTLTGLVSRDEVFRQVVNADFFVSTSYGEGLPVAVIEAMACHSPVILSDIPPHREIAEGVDFIPLVEPDDVAGFAREIERLQAMTVAERQEIGRQCRKLVEDRFSLASMHNRLDEIYAKLATQDVGWQPISQNAEINLK